MRKQWLVLLVAVLASLALWGCGSDGGSGGSAVTDSTDFGTDPASGIAYIGAGFCVDCHENKSFSIDAVADYLASKHVVHSDHINAGSDSACFECHDPIGDGSTLEQYIDAANVPAEGLAAVGCENCHGAGAEHLAGKGLPVLTPDFEVCGSCHNALPESHIPHHPLADNILDNYKLSNHYTGTANGEARTDRTCKRCHSDEGFRLYIDTVGLNDDELDVALAATPDVANEPIQCRTCHDPHSGGLRTTAFEENDESDGTDIIVDGERTYVQVFSAEFQLCTACHMAFLNWSDFDEETGTLQYTLDATQPIHHSDDPLSPSGRAIWDTHFKYIDPLDDTNVLIEGYNINAAAETACTQCHDPHAGSKFEQAFASGIATEWGTTEKFHGDYQSPAFGHGCTPCHSPEGLIELTVGGEYAEASTDVAVIACIACHDLQARNDADDGFELGELRSAPEFAFDNARTLYAEALALDPDTTETLATVEGVEDNAFCLTCHSGRESTASVDAKIAASAGPYSFSNIHYLAAGATLFGNQAKGAYEFAGKAYSSKFEHVESNDLCIECHNAHSGELFFSDPGFGPVGCDNCHTGVATVGDIRDIRMNGSLADYDGDGDATEGMYYEVADLITMLEDELLTAGIEYVPASYPYFFPVGTIEYVRANAAQMTADQLRAAYNLQVASKDPGAYAHNGTYIIEILYDSIEALGGDVSGLTRDAAGHFDAAAEAFRHWDEDGEMSTSCARCHSSEGATAFFNNGTVVEADFKEYTGGISAGLACEACHTAPFDGTMLSVSSVTFPDGTVLDATNAADFFADDSPLCMNCHSGRASGASIDVATPGSDGTYRFINIHYYAAAASMFGSDVNAGYEYDGQTYAGQTSFPGPHTAPGYTTCTGCHMEALPDHTFKPAVGDCSGCHAGTTFQTLAGSPSSNYTNIETLKGELETALVAEGVTFLGGYPYFSGITTLQQLRAAYNWQVADKDPAGYIHNGDYIQQILFDSITDLGGTPSVTRP